MKGPYRIEIAEWETSFINPEYVVLCGERVEDCPTCGSIRDKTTIVFTGSKKQCEAIYKTLTELEYEKSK